ncbi:hypothetical protein [Roseiflexus castenholzii]|uniref:hypothetical protein n=1 Tax=Roseiflexus castenholzii TaxID=120962 RepID=UPI0002FDBB3D|nr:hypothetical protein [Roseiflexus castenholzii]
MGFTLNLERDHAGERRSVVAVVGFGGSICRIGVTRAYALVTAMDHLLPGTHS